MEEKPVGPRAFTIDDLIARGFGSRSFLYDQIACGRLVAKKAGRRTLIMSEALREYWENLPNAEPGAWQPMETLMHKALTETDRVLSLSHIDKVDQLLDKLKWLSSVAGLVSSQLAEDAHARGLIAVLETINLVSAETEDTADRLREIVGTPRQK